MIKVIITEYKATGVALMDDGEAKSFSFSIRQKDTRTAKKIVAEKLSVPATKVLVQFEKVQEVHNFDISKDDFFKKIDA